MAVSTNMAGRFLLDGVDAYDEYGVYVETQGLNGLIAWPSIKIPDSNDWQEEDGLEVDLEEVHLDTKEVQLKLVVSGSYGSLWEFLNVLADGAYHEFYFASLERTFTLRLVSMPNFSGVTNLSKVTIKLNDDTPLTSTAAPTGDIITDTDDYEIDDTSLAKYGVRVLSAMTEVRKAPEVKKNLLRNIKTQDGAIYDSENVNFKSKEVKLKCLMRANSLSELWNNWDALLAGCISTDPDKKASENFHRLYVRQLEHEFEFYYKSCSVSTFYPTGTIWLEFTITLVFIGNIRIDEDEVVLCGTDGDIIVTVEDESAIDLSHKQ